MLQRCVGGHRLPGLRKWSRIAVSAAQEPAQPREGANGVPALDQGCRPDAQRLRLTLNTVAPRSLTELLRSGCVAPVTTIAQPQTQSFARAERYPHIHRPCKGDSPGDSPPMVGSCSLRLVSSGSSARGASSHV